MTETLPGSGRAGALQALRAVFALSLALCAPCAASAQTVKAKPAQTHAHLKATAKPQKPESTPAPTKAADRPVSVTVRANVNVSGSVFTLGEIADIQGDDKGLAAQLAAIEVGASPLPGLSRIINPGDVTVRMRQHHLEGPHVAMVLPPGIRITRSGNDLAPDKITAAAIESAKDAIKGMPHATLELAPTAMKLVVPLGQMQIVAGAWRGSPESGTLSVPVSVLVDGKPFQQVDVPLIVRIKTLVLIAVRDMEPQSIVTEQDVALARITAAPGAGALLTTTESGIGKRARRRLAANTPLSADMLEKVPLISANDAVTIEFVVGALRVTASGVARQGGAEGELIHVIASDTRRDLEGVIIDKHTVRVQEFGNQ